MITSLFLKPTPIRAQDSSIASLPVVKIRLNRPDGIAAIASRSLFRHFEVIDERPDTARIGIHTTWSMIGNTYNRQLVFGRSTVRELSSYLDKHFARPDAPYTALVILRTLWLSDANYIREELDKGDEKDIDKLTERTHIRLKAEVYATRDSLYIPVFRYDTLHNTRKKSLLLRSPYAAWDEDLADLITGLADSASLVTVRKEGHSRLIRRDEIHKYNQSRHPYVPGCGDAMLNRGVYTSFEEFKNNGPSIKDFEIKKDKKSSLLYIKDGTGASYYSRTAWGLYDGKHIFIMKDGELCPAWKEGESIYFLGEAYKESTGMRYEIPSPYGSIPLNNQHPSVTPGHYYNYKQRCIYTLDMETGAVY